MKTILRVFRRELLRIKHRPRYMVLLTLMLVFCYVFFFSLMHEGQPQNLPIGIVDCDGSYVSRRIAHEIDATQGVDVVAVYGSHAEARKAMQKQKIYAFLEIPEGTYSGILDFEAPHIALYSNNAYLLSGNLSYKSLATISKLAAAAVQREVLRKKGYDENRIMGIIQPIELDTHYISNPTANYQPYILPTLLQGIICVMVLLLSVYEIRRERKEGTEGEWLETGNDNMLLSLIGKLLPYTIYFSLLGIVGNLAMFGFCHYTMLGSFWMLNLALVLMVIAQQSAGVLIAGMVSEMHLALCVSAIYGMFSFTLAGFSFPVTSMPPMVQALTLLFPLRQYYQIYVDIALYGCGIGYYWSHLALLVGFAIVALIGVFLLNKEYHSENVEHAKAVELEAPKVNYRRHELKLRDRITDFLANMWTVFEFELRRVFHDEGAMLFFFVGSLLYPLLFAVIYKNEAVRDVPIAVVDESNSVESRRMTHKLDASPDINVDFRCLTMAEAEHLMKCHNVRGVVYFPRDYATHLAKIETARIGVFCDMSSFLYYRTVYTAISMVMLDEMKQIEVVRLNATGLTGEAADVQVSPVQYDDVKLFCPAGGFESFLVPALLVLVIFQTFFFGICVLSGTSNERKMKGISVVTGYSDRGGLLDKLYRNAPNRIVLGRALCYLVLYIPVIAIVLFLFPRMFELPHIGKIGTLILFLLPFVTSSIFFFLTISAFVRERDTGVLVSICFSLVLIFSSGVIWPQCGMPDIWRWFSYLFPSTHGIQGFVRINSMGASLREVKFEYLMLWGETILYFLTASTAQRYQLFRTDLKILIHQRWDQLKDR